LFKKKLSVLFLMLLLTTILFTGCTQTEKGFFSICEEASKLNTFENSGEFTLKFEIPSLLTNFIATDDISSNLINTFAQEETVFKYTSKMDKEKGLFDYDFFIVDKASGTDKLLTKIIINNDVLYVKVDELVNIIQTLSESGYDTSDFNEMTAILGDKEYISMTIDEYLQALGTEDLTLKMFKQNGFFNNSLGEMYQRLVFGLPDAYQNYTINSITKVGNKYSLTLNGNDITNLLVGFLNYSVNNIGDIGNYATSFIQNLSTAEMDLLDIQEQDKTMVMGYILMGVSEVQGNSEKYLQEIAKIQPVMQDQDIKDVLDALTLTSSLEKTGNGIYESNFNFTFNYEKDEELCHIQLNNTDTITACNPFVISLPTPQQVMSYTESLSKTSKANNKATVMEIQVDTGASTLISADGINHDTLDTKIVNNSTYLPMRKIAEALGEDVGYDSAQKRAYVMKNSQEVDMTGTIIDGHTYIKIRDFEKLGYTVDWDSATRTVKLTTPSSSIN